MEAGPVTPTLCWETLSPHTPAAPPDECPTRKVLSVQHYTWRQGLSRTVHGLCLPFITSFSCFASTLCKTSFLSHEFCTIFSSSLPLYFFFQFCQEEMAYYYAIKCIALLFCDSGGLLCMSFVAQLCLTLCHSMDCCPKGSSVHRILQPRILDRVAIPSFRGSCRPKDGTQLSGTGWQIHHHLATREAHWGSGNY